MLNASDVYIKSEIYDTLIRINPIILTIPYYKYLLYLDEQSSKYKVFDISMLFDLIESEEGRFVFNELNRAKLIKKYENKYVFSENIYKILYVIKKYIYNNFKRRLAWGILYLIINRGESQIALGYVSKISGLDKEQIKDKIKLLNLRLNGEKIIISRNKLQELQNILLDPALKVEWPYLFLPKKFGEDERFYLESRRLYVDTPWYIFGKLGNRLVKIGRLSLDELYEDAKRVVREINNELSQLYGGCIEIRLRKYANVERIGIRINIDMPCFVKMLYYIAEVFPKGKYNKVVDDVSIQGNILIGKYNYVNLYKIGWIPTVIYNVKRRREYSSLEGIRNEVRNLAIVKDETSKISGIIKELRENIKKILRIPSPEKLSIKYPHLYFLAPDLLENIDVLEYAAIHGITASCFSEMRRMLESVAWAFLDDILYFSSLEIGNKAQNLFIDTHSLWYKWTLTNCNIKNFYKWKNILSTLLKLKTSKNETPEDFLDKIPISLFIFTMSEFINKKDNEGAEYVPIIRVEEFRKMLLREINTFSRKIHPVNLGYIEDSFSQHKGNKYIVPCLPKPEFVLNYVDDILGLDYGFYEQYMDTSKFVHYYSTTLNVYPFISVLEIIILRSQLEKFAEVIGEAIKYWKKRVRRLRKTAFS